MKKYVKNFEDLSKSFSEKNSDPKDLKKLYGNKALNLGIMSGLFIPVPPGFVISTEACNYFLKNKHIPEGLEEEIKFQLSLVEKRLNLSFGSKENPLLISARSGSSVSMPGMMDTILNLGLNDDIVLSLAQSSKNDIFAYSCYFRFIKMYGEIVLKIPKEKFFHDENYKDLNLLDLKKLIEKYKKVILVETKKEFEQDPYKQLMNAVIAVFNSWNLERAILYRKINNISKDLGTAVTILAMVFGNKGNKSGTGVLFSRDPSTGDPKPYGEFLINAQGEELVSGQKTPESIQVMKKYFPASYTKLMEISATLEKYYKDMQDIEFTIEQDQLWILQCRSGKRTAIAAFRIAIDMVHDGLISKKEAILRLDPESLNQLLKPIFNIESKKEALKNGNLLGKGLNAGPGNVYGRIVLSSDRISEYTKNEEPVIFVRIETSPEDIIGLSKSEGILTSQGGMTSHAALVARQLGKVAIVGFSELHIDLSKREIKIRDQILKEGDYISLDGNSGEIFKGIIQNNHSEIMQVLEYKTLKEEESIIYQDYKKLMSWTEEFKKLQVYANLDQGDQCSIALSLGAEGIGLCRTEHMFFYPEHMLLIQEMILTDSMDIKKRILEKLLKIQSQEFKNIIKGMNGKPVVLRLLDPPLHEFLPRKEMELKNLCDHMKISLEELHLRIETLKESNPMLGNRGCRLVILNPEIVEMQASAIFEAGFELIKDSKITPEIHIMIPFVSHINEIKKIKSIIANVYKKYQIKYGRELKYLVGTMIEIPRAAITADQIAKEVEFFSFGTNDLTQTTFGISRDDSNSFIPYYLENNIFEADPFVQIDEAGVGFLIKLSIEKIQDKASKIKLAICGEHGGNTSSIFFCHRIGINYVSCSVYRIPIARLAAAQAALLFDK